MIDVYKASAGSGKTYTLVQEYLKLLLGEKGEDGKYRLNRHPNDCHSSILAITFTNKATEEMKRRIVNELDVLSAPRGKSPYMDYLCTTFSARPEDLRATAETALRQLLHDYSKFNVSTIDAFFQMVLRTFAFETELAGNYNVELNDGYAISVGISDLKRELHTEKGRDSDRMLRQWLIDFMKTKIDEGKSWDIFRVPDGSARGGDTLYSFAGDMSKETVKRHRDELIDYLRDKSKISCFKEELLKKVAVARADMKNAALEFANIASRFDKSEFSAKFDEKFAVYGDYENITSGKLTTLRNALDNPSKWFKKKTAEKLDFTTVEQINGCINRVIEGYRRIKSYKSVVSNLYYLGLLGDINVNVENFSKENNLVLLSDTNEMLRKIINEEDAPFIYERIGVRLKHFLIDEFQDTSKMQWANVAPLLSNANGGGNDNLIIGDVKQSIYRFRNSDPYLLKDEIYREFPGAIRNFGDDPKGNTNWRSSRNVVLWNNTFFSLLAAGLGMSDIYSNVVQQIAPKNQGKEGHVRIEWLDAEDDADFSECAFSRMIVDIESMLARGYSQKDIAILVDTNSDGQGVIASLLEYGKNKNEQERINVVSEEALLIRKSPAIKIIVGILSVLDCHRLESVGEEDATDKVSLALLSKQFELNMSRGAMSVADAFSDAMEKSKEELDYDYLLGVGTCANLDAIVERIIATQLSDDMRRSQTPFIQAFQDNVADYVSRFGSDLHRFLNWWEDYGRKLTISSPDNIDAVKVMTVHKSKGLEFPCVIIPVCDWNFDKTGRLEWLERSAFEGFDDAIVPPIVPVKRMRLGDSVFDRAFAKMSYDCTMDSLNKTYVAFTRAVDELIIYAPKNRPKDLSSELMNAVVADESRVKNVCADTIINGCPVTLVPSMFFHGGNLFEVGTPPLKKKRGEDSNVVEMPPYRVGGQPDSWKLEIPDSVLESRTSPKFRGIVMHKVMGRVRVKGDLGNALKYYNAKGVITEAEMVEFGEELRRGLDDDRVAEWFDADCRVMRERTIVGEKGDVYRPDRVVVLKSGKTVVIDYKFGEKEDKRYLRQVKNYMDIISSCGYADVEGYVWYVGDGIIRRV